MLKFNDEVIELNNVVAVEQFGEVQYYTTLISIEELSEMRNRIVYDGDAQRGEIDGKPVIDQKHVSKIYESFLNGESIHGHLTWNLRKNNQEDMNYNADSGKLTIGINQLITIPDSAHRHEALKLVADTIDDESILNSMFSLDIYNISKTEEKDLFYTINGKVKAPNKNRTLYLSNDIECRLLRDVVAQSDLDGKIECVRNNAQKDGKLTKFSTLYESIFGIGSGSFNKKDITEETYDEYLKWFIDFYNELIITKEEFSKLKSDDKLLSKQSSMLLEELTWWGYGLLAKELKGDRKWKHKLNSMMNKKVSVEGGASISFFDKQYPLWHATVIKPKFNFITQKQEIGTSVTNSNSTRNSLKKVFSVGLL